MCANRRPTRLLKRSRERVQQSRQAALAVLEIDPRAGSMPPTPSVSKPGPHVRSWLRSCVMAFAISIGGCAQSAVPVATQHPTTNEPRLHVLVRFTNMSLRPSIARVLEGGIVAWTNRSTNHGGLVSFPLSIVESFTCSELRPLFSRTADRLVSNPIDAGSNTLVLPCSLEPGEYEYQLNLFQHRGRLGVTAPDMYNPRLLLPGKIVVVER